MTVHTKRCCWSGRLGACTCFGELGWNKGQVGLVRFSSCRPADRCCRWGPAALFVLQQELFLRALIHSDFSHLIMLRVYGRTLPCRYDGGGRPES